MDSSDEEDLLLLLENGHCSKEHIARHPHIDLQTFTEEQCRDFFRFGKDDLKRLARALRLPDAMQGYNKSLFTGMEGLLLLCRRLAYPNRWVDLVDMFGRPPQELSIIFSTVLNHVYDAFHAQLENLDQDWHAINKLMEYSDAVHALAPLNHCWGFIDGTLRPISKPSVDQKIVFSGHKRCHGIKFQAVMLPNGLIAHIFGPFEGSRHDCALLKASELLPKLENLNAPDGTPLQIYGDAAYGVTNHIQSPFKGANLTEEQKAYNSAMSRVRICVEWGFGKVLQQWAFLDFRKNLKLHLQPIAKLYLVAVILTNCHTCLYGSQTSDHFNMQPPSLENYLM